MNKDDINLIEIPDSAVEHPCTAGFVWWELPPAETEQRYKVVAEIAKPRASDKDRGMTC